MALCCMRELLGNARAGRYAVGAFSVANMECVLGVVDAAEETRAPVILQIAQQRLPYSPLPVIAPMMLAAARRASVPVAVHLDHGQTTACVREALDMGFTSVMIDGSMLPIDENIALTQSVIALAKRAGAAVEAEVGRVGREETGKESPAVAATLDDCLRMDEIGVDALAVGIGNAHGLYAATPNLRYDILEALRGRLRAALVLHGGSGLTKEQFQRLIALGMVKINIATEIFMAAASGRGSGDLFSGIAASRNAVRDTAAAHIRLFGSEGRA